MWRSNSDRSPLHRSARRRGAGHIVLAAVAGWSVTNAAALLTPQRALAQDSSARPCTEIENDTERLACYDRALRPARTAAPAVAPNPQSAPAQAAAPAAAAATATAAGAAAGGGEHIGTATTVEPRTARAARTETAPAAPAAPASPAAAGVPATAAEQVGIVPIVIVDVRERVGRNDKIFTTDLGAVWMQTDNVRTTYPEPPFEAELKPGMMGSFFLVIDDRGRAVRVKRSD